jgi:DNA-directed RNA polymerase I subunit RPA1
MEGSTEITGVSFGFFDPKDVVAMSVQEIDVSMTFDELGMPIPGGLYDPALGPTSVQGDICPTCHLGYKSCPGHVGHISLSVPVYNPLTFDSLVRLMKYKCACCHRLKRRRDEVRRFVVKCGLIDMGQWKHALELDREIAECAGDLDAKNETKRSHEVEVLTRHEANLARYRQNVASGKRAKHVLHTHERQSREKIVKEFMKGMPLPSRKCMNCGAFSPLLRKDGYTKLFQKDLLPKQIKDNHNNGTVFKPLLSDSDMKAVLAAADALDGKAKGGKKSKKKKAQADKINEDMQHSSDEEEDSDGDAGHADTFDDSGDRGAMDGAHRERREQYLAPTLVRRMLQVLWHRESAALELIWSTPGGTSSSSSASLIDPADASSMARGVDLFFMSTIPVCPSRFRPPTNMGDMQIEHPLNTYLKQILNTNEELMLAKQGNDGGDNMLMDSDSGSDSSDSGSDSDIDTKKKDKKLSIEPAVKAISNTDMVKTWVKLQESVNCLIDSSRSSTPDMPSGVRQVLEKKEGLFRRNMMGKRVNFACRSVISPDPYIDTHEVGLPLRFAKKLTFPEPVTPFNFDSLRQAVVNGPDVHPGANYVEDEFGMKVDLARRTKEEREAIAQMLRTPAVNAPPGKCKIVYRQLVSGDVMLANRQPTLHKPSIMAHVARVLPNPTWQTIRLHYANCNTYNADFDGDEINLHFPQSQHVSGVKILPLASESSLAFCLLPYVCFVWLNRFPMTNIRYPSYGVDDRNYGWHQN